jgi:hypothetical protein
MAAFWNKKNDTKLSKAMVKFAQARSAVYVKFPRLYDALDLCHVQMNFQVPTLGVAPQPNGEFNFVWNPDFIDTLSEKQTEGVVKHELLHIVFEHTTKRFPVFEFDIFDPKNQTKIKADDAQKAKLWNIATDCAINQFIRGDLQDPAGAILELCYPEKFQLPEWLNAEAYYRLLAEQMKDQMDQLKDLQKKLLDAHKEWEQEGQEGKEGKPQQGQSGKPQPQQSTAGHGGATKNDPNAGNEEEVKASDITGAKAEKDADDKEANNQKVKDIAEDLGVDKFDENADKAMAGKQQGGTDAGKYGQVGPTTVVMDYGAGVTATPGWMRKTKHESTHGFDIVIEATRKP